MDAQTFPKWGKGRIGEVFRALLCLKLTWLGSRSVAPEKDSEPTEDTARGCIHTVVSGDPSPGAGDELRVRDEQQSQNLPPRRPTLSNLYPSHHTTPAQQELWPLD